VIRALNTDMPFDEFTRKQIAGDLFAEPTMDDLVATAVHRLTQTNEEGGTDDERFRVEAVIDRVNTTWQAWQGLTFGCVQCHSHPYDPIEHAEYYRFLAFFNNTADTDLPSEMPTVRVPLDESDAPRARQLDRRRDAVWREFWEPASKLLFADDLWEAPPSLEARTNNDTRVEVAEVDGRPGYRTRGTVARNTTVVLTSELPSQLQRLTALRFTGYPEDPQQAALNSEWGYVLSHVQAKLISADGKERTLKIARVIADEARTLFDPQLSLEAKTARGAGPYSRIFYPRQTGFVFAEPVEVASGDRLQLSLSQRIVETGAFPLVANQGVLEFSGDKAWTRWWRADSTQQRLAELAQIRRERRQIPAVSIPVMRERESHLRRPNHVFDRGNYLTKTAAVEPATPNFLPPLPEVSDGQLASRRQLAEWLASPENPLTARVAVNRVWAALFGVGLVETQEDFGAAGTPPSHPRLLDDLAVRFQSDMQWSLKRLLRELVLSATYRQAAVTTPEKRTRDPRNRLLSRGPRVRLPAEMIRDQALAIAGLLSDKQFGPPVHPPIPAGVWKPFQGGDKWNTPSTEDEDRYRRSVYTYTKRSIPYPLFASFDAPSREFCTARRLPSNTPLQALMTLNDQTFIEAAAGLAERMREHSDQLDAQLRYGMLLAICREPQREEIDALRELYEASAGAAGKAGGLQKVATVLLNLDEAFTK
jgi:hypothetical protein